MTLLETLKEAQKEAMRAKDKLRLGTIRMTLAAVKQREIDERIELTEGDVLAIVTKMVKQRKDAAQQFADAVDEKTALIATSHIFYTTSYIQDIEALSDIAHQSGAFLLVDGYQAPGQIPVDLAKS